MIARTHTDVQSTDCRSGGLAASSRCAVWKTAQLELHDHNVARSHVVLLTHQDRLSIGTGKAGTQVEQRIVRSNAQLGRLLGIGTNGLDRAVANRDNRRSANTLDLGKNRLVLKIGRLQLTVGVKRHQDVLLKDGLAVGRTHALDMQ